MVIQRWQTVMLLIASVMMGIFSFVSLGQIQSQDYTFNVSAMGICREGIASATGEPTEFSTHYLFIVSLLSGLLSLIGIFCYKNMKLQKNLIIITMLITVVVGALVCFGASKFASGFGTTVSYSVFIGTPLVALIADILAYRMISSDQKKLRAADRLR